MSETPTVTRQVDLRGCAAFANALVTALRGVRGIEVLPALRAGVRGACPQCHLRLFGEDVLALGASEAPQADVSPKLHRLSQGFCGRQGCEALFYEFTFEPVTGVDWPRVLADTDAALGVGGTPAVAAEQAVETTRTTARKRTALRVAWGASWCCWWYATFCRGARPRCCAKRSSSPPIRPPCRDSVRPTRPRRSRVRGTPTPRASSAPPGRKRHAEPAAACVRTRRAGFSRGPPETGRGSRTLPGVPPIPTAPCPLLLITDY